MTDRADVLVVGGAMAGVRTAESLRRLGFAGTVTVVDEGSDLLYDRPALSKQILTEGADAASVMLRSRADMDGRGIDLHSGSRAVGLDVGTHTVRLADGAAITYGELVIATGASPRRLPQVTAGPGVHYLRTLADAQSLREALASSHRVVVVGAGFIGSEVAAAAADRGSSVTMVEPFAFPLARVLGDVVGDRLAQMHRRRGVELMLGRSVDRIDGDGAPGRRVVLDDGAEIGCDVVVVGVGALPNTDWLVGSGLDVSDGVVCDQFCRTGQPHVYAAGDVARWSNPLFGEVMRIEHWTNAVEQATVVAWNIVNPDRPRAYAPVPYVWSDQYGNRLQIVGRPRADDELRIVSDDTADERLVALYVRDSKLTGAFTMNSPQQSLALRRALTSHTPLEEISGVVASPV